MKFLKTLDHTDKSSYSKVVIDSAVVLDILTVN